MKQLIRAYVWCWRCDDGIVPGELETICETCRGRGRNPNLSLNELRAIGDSDDEWPKPDRPKE